MQYPSLAPFPLTDILRLIRAEGIGPHSFFDLLARFGSPAEALEAGPHLAPARRGHAQRFTPPPLEAAERELAALEAFGARCLAYGSPEYPALLTEIDDAPPLLFALGNVALAQHPSLAIVGSRNASQNGRTLTRSFAQAFGKAGYAVTSGLARGIDAEAHAAALSTGTIGVIAGGIDSMYPPENKALYGQMREQGLILTEHPFGSPPSATNFPRRNRIIAGISTATLVIEASLQSGTLITARLAAEQGREVFALPGSPLDPRCAGTNRLLKHGAVFTETPEDVLHAVRHSVPKVSRQPMLFDGPEPSYPAIREPEIPPHEAGPRGIILEQLSPAPLLLDALLEHTRLPHGTLHTILLELELEGRIERLPGNRIALLATL